MSKREFVIPFVGLKIGNHIFEYDIDKAFFDGIDYSIIHDGNVHVKLELEKKETMMVGVFHVDGKVFTNCCLLYTSPSPRDRQKSRMPSSA